MTQNEELIRYMEQQVPFNRVLGIEITAIEKGSVIMRVPMKPEFIGDPVRPAVHGGVISALADTVAGLAVFTCIEWGRAASTVDLRVDYLRPGRVDQDLYAKATVMRVGNRVAATHTIVYQDDPDAPIATSNAVYNVVRLKVNPLSGPETPAEPDRSDPHS